MAKFIVFVFAATCFANANPIVESTGNTAVENAYTSNNGWPNYQYQPVRFPQYQMPQFHVPQFHVPQFHVPQFHVPQIQMPKMLTPEDISKLQPVSGGTVSGGSFSTSTKTEMIDGKPVTTIQGESVVNKNGVIERNSFEN